MDVTIFIETCARENPIDLYNITLGSLIEEVPEDEADKHNLMVMTIDLLADTLYEEKEFEKAEELILTLKNHQPELYSDSVLSLLPELIYYYLHINNKEKAKYYMDDLAQFPDEDFLLFIHIIDVFDAYGLTNYAKQIISYLVVNENSFSTEKREILDNYLEQLKPNTDNETLLSLRTGFLDMSKEFSIPQISADNIIDVLIDYYDNHKHKKDQNLLLLDEMSFRIFITTLLDPEFMDTYEYAASVVWGAVYFMDYIKSEEKISEDEYNKNIEILEKCKAFILINIPWDGYWRLRFLHIWNKPKSIDLKEFETEDCMFNSTLELKPADVINKSYPDIFSEYFPNLSYSKYFKEEEEKFNKLVEEESGEDADDKKKDSMFPYFNYLSGESENEIRPKKS